MCWTKDGAADDPKIWLPNKTSFDFLFIKQPLYAHIEDGLLEHLFVECSSTPNTLRALTEKFGKPRTYRRSVLQNLMGVQFFGYEAEWTVRDVQVSFDGNDLECTAATIETTRYQQLEKQRRSELQKTRPKL